jgi:DNA-binding XRE family transcriptional regulator
MTASSNSKPPPNGDENTTDKEKKTMATTHPLASHPEALALRKQAGAYLKSVREKAELSQNDLAKRVGLEYYTMVSQIERGQARLPPDKQMIWAKSLGVDPQEFARTLLRYYDPYTWTILFGNKKH